MKEPQRITKRQVSSYSDDKPHFGLSADLEEIDVSPGDKVKVITYDDEIVIRSVDDE